MRRRKRHPKLALPAAALALAFFCAPASADDRRAEVNYMLHCQGCHLADGAGTGDRIPQLRDFVGLYLHSEAGRAFVINVTGVAMSSLGDRELSEMINWMLLKFSAKELPKPFRPYTPEEVAQFRKAPDLDPAATRNRIIGELRRAMPELKIPGTGDYASD